MTGKSQVNELSRRVEDREKKEKEEAGEIETLHSP